MAVDSVKCALSSATSSTNSTKLIQSANCLVLDCCVMTNVCSPGLALSAQSQSPTRPQSLSPNLNTSAESNSITSVLLNNNSSAMQQLIENTNNLSPSNNLVTADQATSILNQSSSPIHNNSQEMERPNEQIRDEDLDDEMNDSQSSSRNSRTNASSPNNQQPPTNHSPQSIKIEDRKEVSFYFFVSLFLIIFILYFDRIFVQKVCFSKI